MEEGKTSLVVRKFERERQGNKGFGWFNFDLSGIKGPKMRIKT